MEETEPASADDLGFHLSSEPALEAAEETVAAGPPGDRPTHVTKTVGDEPGELAVGAIFGPYRILGRVGKGGMGTVYKALHLKLGRVMAVKILPASVSRNAVSVARFEREMKAVGRLSHPNIVQAHDAGDAGGVHYLAMEYIEGSDLARRVRLQGRLAVAEACNVIRQAAEGLAAAHRAGIVHRDVKPSNLLLDGQGGVKILDLGLARSLLPLEGEHENELTADGQTFGTPDYMAPEQWGDARAVDGRADLYALGCTLYFLLTGKTPFGSAIGGGLTAIMRAHLTESPPDPRAIRDDIPEGVAVILARLLAKEPSARFVDAESLAAALSAYTGSHAAESSGSLRFGPPTLLPAESPRRVSAPARLLFPALGLVLALAVGAGWLEYSGRAKSPDRPGVAEAPPASPSSVERAARPRPSSAMALRFSGRDIVIVPTLSSLPDRSGPFTLEMFVTLERPIESGRVALLKLDDQLALRISTGDLLYAFSWYMGGERSKLDTAVVAEPGKRVHLAAVRSPEGVRVFLDGRLSAAAEAAPGPLDPGTEPLQIGEAFPGILGEIRLSTTARYRDEFVPPTRFEPDPQTLALYHADEGSGERLIDASGNGHHGVISGATWVEAGGKREGVASP